MDAITDTERIEALESRVAELEELFFRLRAALTAEPSLRIDYASEFLGKFLDDKPSQDQ